jgi:hypothetical protein
VVGSKPHSKVPIFTVPAFPFPTHTPGRMLSQRSCKTYKARFSFLAPRPAQSQRSAPWVPNSPGRKGRGGPGSRAPQDDRGPGRVTVPTYPGGAAHRRGGRAGRGRAEGAAGGFWDPRPNLRRVKRENEGGAGCRPHPLLAGPPLHSSPGLLPPPAIFLSPPQFPQPSPSPPFPLTPCHSPPHRLAAVPPSSSSPAAAAAAVCSVLVGARNWRQEMGAI